MFLGLTPKVLPERFYSYDWCYALQHGSFLFMKIKRILQNKIRLRGWQSPNKAMVSRLHPDTTGGTRQTPHFLYGQLDSLKPWTRQGEEGGSQGEKFPIFALVLLGEFFPPQSHLLPATLWKGSWWFFMGWYRLVYCVLKHVFGCYL